MKNMHECNWVGPQVLSILVMASPYSFNIQQHSRDIAKYFRKIIQVYSSNWMKLDR